MTPLHFPFPLLCASFFLIADLIVWRLINRARAHLGMCVRLAFLLAFSLAMIDGGLSLLSPVPDSIDGAQHTLATILAIAWWLFAARALTVFVVVLLEPRIGGKGHLLQDLMGAGIFLMAMVAAAGYTLDLPVKGLLATSGAVAIILALAVQSTLSDVFSGIVLNATKPFRVDDLISIDGIEGKVVEIDWRSTYLLTSAGSMVVIPNAMAAKTRITNLSRPNHFHPVVLTIELPIRLRPALVLDSLHKALKGCRELMPEHEGSAVVKKSGLRSVEYEITGYVRSRERRGFVRNQLHDLIFRQLNASDSLRQNLTPASATTRAGAALGSVSVLSELPESDRAQLESHMRLCSFPSGAEILPLGVIPDAIMIVESGVVTVTIENSDGTHELGRMGPGELMGEGGLIDNSKTLVRFIALTDCVLYRVDRSDIQPGLADQENFRSALIALAQARAQFRKTLFLPRTEEAAPTGLLHWLRGRVTSARPANKRHNPH